MKLTKLPIPSRALDGIVSPRFPTRQLLPGRPFTNELLRERLHAITLPDSAATPPSFIPDKGKSGGSWPGRYANTARVRGRRNSKPVFRITFSLSSRQIRRPLSPLEGHLYSSFWRGRGKKCTVRCLGAEHLSSSTSSASTKAYLRTDHRANVSRRRRSARS